MSSLPADPFGRIVAPTREARVARLIATAAELARDERPAMRQLAHAIRRYLAGDARSIEHALGIAAERGSHLTAQALARRLLINDEATPQGDSKKLPGIDHEDSKAA